VLGVLVGSSSAYPVTDLLLRWREGDAGARETLVPLVYDELRRIARKCLTGQRNDHTLQPTALVHEAYLRLVRPDGVSCQNRAHFFSVAARVMRQILVDHSRRRVAAKRGGGAITLLISDESSSTGALNLDFLALEEAMRRLAILDARQCQIVELRFFGGLSIEETAQIVEISPATAKREWATARIWLYQAMSTSAEI
jgi:RNA polymerase sigma factor (TIGR02999 family)